MKNKFDSSYSINLSDETDTVVLKPPKDPLQCDQCEYKETCKLDICKHIGSKHNTVPHLYEETNAHMEFKETQAVPSPDLLPFREASPGWDVWCFGQDCYCDLNNF